LGADAKAAAIAALLRPLLVTRGACLPATEETVDVTNARTDIMLPRVLTRQQPAAATTSACCFSTLLRLPLLRTVDRTMHAIDVVLDQCKTKYRNWGCGDAELKSKSTVGRCEGEGRVSPSVVVNDDGKASQNVKHEAA